VVKSGHEDGAAVPGAGESDQRMWPMGAVTRRTGLGEHTLRAWERRFGFPTPHRLASGHRRYSAAQVRHLLLIARALKLGHRAGDVVPLPSGELEDLLRDTGVVEGLTPAGDSDKAIVDVIDACRKFDRDAIVGMLRRDATALGMSRFLRERVGPLLEEIGEAWSRGGIEIRHEHFFSEVLEDELRFFRTPLEVSAVGPPVVLATLPNEIHGLGLQIAALEITARGRAVRVLGPQLPPDEIVAAALALEAAAVGISVSLFSSAEETVRNLGIIRSDLPKSVELWLGGSGTSLLATVPDGVRVLPTLDELDHAVKGLRA